MQTNRFYTFVFFIIILTISSIPFTANAQESSQFVVVLDAGHGGHDPGNLGSGYKEKSIALKIVLEVGKELGKNKDIKVIYTRKTDVFVTLRGRARIANKADADLFVSVHCNSHHTSANGTETFVLGVTNNKRNIEIAKKENEVIFLEDDYEKHYEGFDPNSPESFIGLTLLQEEYVDQSIQLASFIEKSFKNKLKRKSRGVKQSNLWVMHNTYMPSVLVEVGFLTYKPEGKYLNSKKGQLEMSKSIKEAILKYKKQIDLNVGQNVYDTNTDETEDEIINEVEQIYANTVFKIQIAAGPKKIEPKSYNFKGLKDISRKKENKLFKYFYGYTSDYSKAKRLKKDAVKKGYKDCYLVAYQNGKRVKLSTVLNSTTN